MMIRRSTQAPGGTAAPGPRITSRSTEPLPTRDPGSSTDRSTRAPSPILAPGLDDSVVGGAVYTPFGRDAEG
jgi:hypothetical protein